MATGDKADIASRFLDAIPRTWLPDDAPVANALAQGLGAQWATIYNLLSYTSAQTRIQTATGGWLDLVANDFFGSALQRNMNETDAAFSARIVTAIFQHRNTREAITLAVIAATGRAPLIFEPMRSADTGGYDTYALGYDCAGAYTDCEPFVAFVTAYRPPQVGIPYGGGYDTPYLAFDDYGEWVDSSMTITGVPDAAIYAAIDAVRPAGITLWVSITDGPGGSLIGINFIPSESNVV